MTGNLDVTGSVTADGLTVDGLAQISAQTNGAYALRVGDTEGSSGSVQGIGKIGINPQNAGAFTYTGTEIRATELGSSGYKAGLSFHTRNSISDVEPLKRLGIAYNGDISFYEDTGTTAKLFWDASAETLAIGHTNPSASYGLDVNGGIRSFGSAPSYTLREDDASSQTWLMASYGGTFAIRDTTVSGTAYPFQIDAATPTNTLHLKSTGIDVTGTATMDGLTVSTTSVTTAKIEGSQAKLQFFETDTVDQNYQLRLNGGDLILNTLSDLEAVTGTFLRIDAGGDISFYEDTGTTAKLFWDASAEKLGIGNTAPSYTLDVASGAANNQPLARFSSSGGVRAVFNTDSDDDGSLSLYDKSDVAKVLIRSLGSSYINGGSLGIGVTNPSTQLEISNTASAVMRLSTSDTSVADNQEIGALEYYQADGSGAGAGVKASIRAKADNSTAAQTYLAFHTSDSSNNDIERLRLNADGSSVFSGNVLIKTTTHTPTDTELLVSSEYSASGTTTGGITLSARQSGNWRNCGIFANGTDLTFTTGDTGLNGAQASSEQMRISYTGNVLIGGTSGTAAPTLDKGVFLQSVTEGDVIGYSLYANEGTNNRRSSFFLDDTNGIYGFDTTASTGVCDFVVRSTGTQRLKLASNGDISFYNGSGNQAFFWDSSTSRLGLGTTAPVSTLEISKADQTNGATLSITNSFEGGSWTAGDTIGTVDFRVDDVSATEKVRGRIKVFDDTAPGNTYPYANAMSFSTGYLNTLTEHMRITSLGRVGINTALPTAALSIVEAGLSTQFRISNTENDATTKYGAIVGSHYTNAEAPITGMLITSSSSVAGGSVSIGGGVSASNAVNAVKFYTAANNTTAIGTERMRIDSLGRVGIGCTPATTLDVAGSGAEIAIRDTRNITWTIGDTVASLGFYSDDASGGSGSTSNLARGSIDLVATSTFGSTHDMVFKTRGDVSTSALERLRINSVGNVGIGCDPADKLHVEGNIYLGASSRTVYTGGSANLMFQTNTGSHLFLRNNGSSEVMRIDTSGNVLVGKSQSSSTTLGVQLVPTGAIYASRDGNVSGVFDRKTNDGIIIQLRKNGLAIGAVDVVNGNNLAIGGTVTGHAGIQFGTGTIFPELAGNASTGNGAVDLGQSTGRFRDLYLAGGVVFGPASASNVSSQTLDSYEQGNWTPTIIGSTSGSITGFTVSDATYTKIGDTVRLSCYLSSINMTTSTVSGQIKIGGVPFSSDSFADVAAVTHCTMFSFDESTTSVSGYLSGSYVLLRKGSSVIALTDADERSDSTAAQIMLSVTYKVA
tara:strand:- start:50 stop:3931 length:3882 start_codon:yes stop_codon:yes gene_type:complete